MPTDTLDRLQENKLRGLEDLIETLEAVASGSDDAAAIADFFVDEGIGLRQASLHLWDYSWAQAVGGKIHDPRERRAKLRSLLERGARLLERYAVIARHYADSSGHEIARLAQFEDQVRQFPLWIAECLARWEMLDRPRKPLNRERVAGSQAAYGRGEGEPVSEVIARLKQGGPLVKD
jgi:hypothetical protein